MNLLYPCRRGKSTFFRKFGLFFYASASVAVVRRDVRKRETRDDVLIRDGLGNVGTEIREKQIFPHRHVEVGEEIGVRGVFVGALVERQALCEERAVCGRDLTGLSLVEREGKLRHLADERRARREVVAVRIDTVLAVEERGFGVRFFERGEVLARGKFFVDLGDFRRLFGEQKNKPHLRKDAAWVKT